MHQTTVRCTVEITWEEDKMEFTVGELMVLILYFMNNKKFLCHVHVVVTMPFPESSSTISYMSLSRTVFFVNRAKQLTRWKFCLNLDAWNESPIGHVVPGCGHSVLLKAQHCSFQMRKQCSCRSKSKNYHSSRQTETASLYLSMIS